MLIKLTTAASGCFVTMNQNCAVAACSLNRNTICNISCILRSLPSPTILPTKLPTPAQFGKITTPFSSAGSVQEAVLRALPYPAGVIRVRTSLHSTPFSCQLLRSAAAFSLCQQ